MRLDRSLSLRAAAGAVVALAVAVTLASCGIPTDTQARGVDPPPPYQDFYATTPPSSEPTGTPTAGAFPEVLCLTRGGSLVEVTRYVDEPPSVQTLAEDLVTAPSPEEQEQGLASTVAVPLLFEPPVVTDGLAVVEFGEGRETISQDATLTMVAQIVCTLDQHPDVNAVVFTNDGVTASVPKGDGMTTDQPVTRDDYVILLESATPPTPAVT